VSETTEQDRDRATVDEIDGIDGIDGIDAIDEGIASTGAPAGRRPRRRFDRGLFVASVVIAIGVLLIVWGFTTALTGEDGLDRPEAIESVQPVENAVQVLQQERIVVDLEAGYEGRLLIDGVELPTTIIGQSDVDPAVQAEPGQQVELPTTAIFDPGNAVISFQPVEGAVIESLEQGTREATGPSRSCDRRGMTVTAARPWRAGARSPLRRGSARRATPPW
jgi:hypothetical protein